MSITWIRNLCRARPSIALTAIVAFCQLISLPLHGQVAGGTLSGTVTDESGAVIPGVKISIRNLATQVTREMATDTAGLYSAPNLLPGDYEITASADGFETQVRRGVNLNVGAQQILNLTMRLGQVTERVQVAGDVSAVQLATSSIGGFVNSTTVRELPLNGRSWTDLATLQPGVTAVQTQLSYTSGTTRGNRGFGNQVSMSGARPQENSYRLDGISIDDYANGGPGSVLGGNLGVDAIQEFSVSTSNSSGEYGRSAGGVVNAITRSGTNEFHGAAYEFLRNNALDARNFFDGPNPPFRRNQFGADLGGPILKNKVFFFADYEGIRQSKGITTLDTVPSAAARSGNLCSSPDARPACSPRTVTVDPAAQKYLPFWPLPNRGIQPGTNGDIGIFTFAAQQVINENFGTVRVDDKLSDKDSLFATYLGDVTPYTAPDILDQVLKNSITNRQVAILEETHIFRPTLVNTTRLGFNRAAAIIDEGVSAINPLANDPLLGVIPGQFAAGVGMSGVTGFPGGVGTASFNRFYWNSFQLDDDAFWTHGAHSVKFGVSVERIDFNAFNIHVPGGSYTFSTLSDFLANKPKRFQLGFPDSVSPRGLRQTLLGLYVHDDWHLRSNLTVNLGLRWEMATVPTEVQNKLDNLVNITDPTPHLGSPLFYNPTLRNFEPRVGFSWDPFRNGKTAVRGGFGIFDMLPLPNQIFFRTGTTYPFYRIGQANKLAPGSFYTGGLSQVNPAANREAYIEQHPHRSYTMQWNFNLQRELARDLVATAGYVGARGVHLPFPVDDMNIVIPQNTPYGYLFPSPIGSGTVINPNVGDIIGMPYNGSSTYHGLQTGIQKRMAHGFQIQGAFTWGKSIDSGSSTILGDQFSNSITSLPWYDPRSFRGLSDFNVGRTFVVNAIWQVPSPKSLSGPAGWISSGWELGGIYKVSDGVPFTATFGTDGDPQGLNSSDPWDFPSLVGGGGCQSLVNPGNPNHYIKTECFTVPLAPTAAFYKTSCDPAFPFPQCLNLRGNAGRNILTGPGLSNLDLSLFKNNYVKRISESFNVQFRAEFFNILNRANFSVPATSAHTDIFDSTGAPTGVAGLLTSTTTTAREIQLALKVVW